MRRARSGNWAASRRNVPIMALSAFLADTAKVGSIREEFDLALAKPAGRDALHDAIQTMLGGDSAR